MEIQGLVDRPEFLIGGDSGFLIEIQVLVGRLGFLIDILGILEF